MTLEGSKRYIEPNSRQLAAMQGLTLDEYVFNFHSLQVDLRYNNINSESAPEMLTNFADMFVDYI